MTYLATLREAGHDAQQLETTYRAANQSGDTAAFAEAVHMCYAEAPDNPLYAAWHYRLDEPAGVQAQASAGNWRLAIVLSILGGLLFWLLSDFERIQLYDNLPLLPLVGAAISAWLIIFYLRVVSGQHSQRLVLISLGLAGFVAYGILTAPRLSDGGLVEQYQILTFLHLSLLAWSGIGIFVLWSNAAPDNRFAFLLKSLEALITGGLFLIAGGVFAGITFAMFNALGIQLPEFVERLFAAGGAGLIPVLAVAMVYQPGLSPIGQSFSQGLSRLIATLMRLLLPLTLIVLAIYIVFIPFNFWEPFRNREVLIVYNAMLFAIMGLLVGATPVQEHDLSTQQRLWLRRGILAVTVLAVAVSVYASAAILYRTWEGGLTANRFTVIGWNLVNIAILLLLLYKQWQAQPVRWLAAMHETFSVGTILYVIWGAVVVICIPLLF